MLVIQQLQRILTHQLDHWYFHLLTSLLCIVSAAVHIIRNIPLSEAIHEKNY